MDLPVSMIKEISGSRFLFSGVGTQMMTASTSLMRRKSVEAENLPRLHHFRHGLGGNVLDIASAGVQGVDLGRIDVQPQHGHARTRELKRQRKADVAQTNDCCFHLSVRYSMFHRSKYFRHGCEPEKSEHLLRHSRKPVQRNMARKAYAESIFR